MNKTVQYCSRRYTITGDMADAHTPIMLDGVPTGFNTADASHSATKAVRLAMASIIAAHADTIGADYDEWDTVPVVA